MLRFRSVSFVLLAAAAIGAFAACSSGESDGGSSEDGYADAGEGSYGRGSGGRGSGGRSAARRPGAGGAAAALDPEIGPLVLKAGTMSTTLTGDAAPVPKGAVTREVLGDGEFICNTQPMSLTKVPDKFVLLSPNADVLYPGSLVQGKSMSGGILDPIPVKRAPGSLTLTIVSGADAGTTSVEVPTLAEREAGNDEGVSLENVYEAQQTLLRNYDAATPAKLNYYKTQVFSMSQLAVEVGAFAEGSNFSVSASLKFNESETKNRLLIQYSQEYYTIAYKPPQGPEEVFHPSVTMSDIEPYVGDGNPPVYVSSVTYGRLFYLLLESTESFSQLEAKASAAFGSGGVKAGANAAISELNQLSDINIKAYALGGNAAHVVGALEGTPAQVIEKVNQYITEGASFSKDSPGVPVSYTIRHLADASQVKMALTTEFNARSCFPQVENCGGGKKLDTCGICGGNGLSCAECPAELGREVGIGAHGKKMTIDLPYGWPGATVRVLNGREHWFDWYCRHVDWRNIQYTCKDGAWQPHPDAHVGGGENECSDSNYSDDTGGVSSCVCPESYNDKVYIANPCTWENVRNSANTACPSNVKFRRVD